MIRAVGGRPEDHGGSDTALPAFLAALGWGGVALILAAVAQSSGRLTLVASVLIGLAALLTWAYVVERHRRRGLEIAQGMSRAVLGAAQTEAALVTMLERACSTFHCPIAEVILFPTGAEEQPMRTTVLASGQHEVMVAIEASALSQTVRDVSSASHGALISGESAHEAVHGLSASGEPRVALVAPLRGESRVLGTIAVAGSDATDAALEAADVELFEALAAQVGSALEYGQVERSLAQLGELERKLAHQAYHDSLTGLANRTLFIDLMERALIRNVGQDGGVVALFGRSRQLQGDQRQFRASGRRRRAHRGGRADSPLLAWSGHAGPPGR